MTPEERTERAVQLVARNLGRTVDSLGPLVTSTENDPVLIRAAVAFEEALDTAYDTLRAVVADMLPLDLVPALTED